MTREEIQAKQGVYMLLPPRQLHEELSAEEAKQYEDFLVAAKKFHEEIDRNIEIYCSRCKYYQTEESDKCDSWIHGSSYGVSCRYIAKAKGEDLTWYNNRKVIDF